MDRILRTPEVVKATGLSNTTIWRRVRSGDFPVPLKLGSLGTRSIGWELISEVVEIEKAPVKK